LQSRLETREEVELLGASCCGSRIEIEMEGTCSALERSGQIEGQEGGYVPAAAVFEDFTACDVVMYGAGTDFVLRAGRWCDCIA